MTGIHSEPAKQRLFFFHVPKTGGSTIRAYLATRFGPEMVLTPKKNKTLFADVWLGRKCKNNRSLNEDYLPSIGGHFASSSLIAGHESDYYKVCFWRHPADWALSYYNWRLHVQAAKLKRAYSIMDLVGSFARNPMTQDFLLYYGDVPGWRYFLMSDRLKFKAAVRLAKQFDLFADISKIDAFLRETRLVNGAAIERHKSIPHKAVAILDPERRHHLERWNPVDYYVHLFSVSSDKERVIAEAHDNLSAWFPMRDVIHFIARPYYRLNVMVIPFIMSSRLTEPSVSM